ncbi:MAG: FecR domain-containing protein [Candidatus Eremiobacteraeota bacterium]|nr:FecR domain-containing protein [Candidatus Eremiobacteraeota bacterium]
MAQYTVAGAPGVANISVIQGDVVIVRGDSGEQVAATINAPLLPGDYISTSGGSRSEVQFDGISMLRLAADTQVRFVNLDPRAREMQLAVGTAELAELQSADGNPQIDTPSLTLRPNRAGDYRVSVLSNGQTLVTVRSGSATVTTGSGSQTLTPGSTLVAYGPYANPSISLGAAIAFDAFDAFNANRDNAIIAAWNSDRYLAPQLAGYSNLASYGQWYNVPGYGESWAPYNQANDWSPYSNGQWVWEPGYGYTWVGNEPWGYAPYHYGNWFYANNYNQWMWQPPAYQYQTNADLLASTWLPALVGFFLTGGNSGLGYNPYGYGNIGWVPLAPGEQYTPWYSGFGYNAGYPQYGIGNVTYITNVYRNIRYVRVIRMYPFERFRDGDWHRPIIMHPDQLKRVGVLHGPVPIPPSRALLRSGPIAVTHLIVLSSQFRAQRFAARAPVVRTVDFAKSQAALQTIASKPPKLISVAPRPAVAAHAEYRPPTVNATYHAPVVTAHPTTMHPTTAHSTTAQPVTSRPVGTVAPRSIATMAPYRPTKTTAPVPVHTMVPFRPARTAEPAPARTAQPAPMRTMTPQRTAVPAFHTSQPVMRQTAPLRTASPVYHPATPVRTVTPARTAVPAQQRFNPPHQQSPAQSQTHKPAATAPARSPKPEKSPPPVR